MSNPSGDEEELKELVGRERVGRAEHDPEARNEAIYRAGHNAPYDDPDNDSARSNAGLWLLVVIVVAIIAYIVYLAFS